MKIKHPTVQSYLRLVETNTDAIFEDFHKTSSKVTTIVFKTLNVQKTKKKIKQLATTKNIEIVELSVMKEDYYYKIIVSLIPSEPKDVIIALPTKKGLKHLEEKIEALVQGKKVFFSFSHIPNLLEVGCLLYVCCEGYVRGAFKVSEISYEEAKVWCDMWLSLPSPVSWKSFQGYCYVQPEEYAFLSL